MSFELTGFGKLDNNPNTGINNIWGYVTSGDTLATVKGSDYFATVSDYFSVNDVIRVNASNGIEWLTVTQVTPSVTTIVEFPAGDISADEVQAYTQDDATPAISVEFDIAVPGGATNTQSVTLNQQIKVTDFYVMLTSAGTAGDTIQLTDNDDNPITDALDVSGSDEAVVRMATYNDANALELSGNALKVVETDSEGSDSPSAVAIIRGYISS